MQIYTLPNIIRCIALCFCFTSTVMAQDTVDDDIPLTRKEILGKPKTSKIYSFKDKKAVYKSPKKAMFLSLALPGAGQYYVGGKKNYIKAALYSVADIGVLSAWVYLSGYKRGQKLDKAKEIALNHFSPYKNDAYVKGVYDHPDTDKTTFVEQHGDDQVVRKDYCEGFYREAGSKSCDKINLSWNDHLVNLGGAPLSIAQLRSQGRVVDLEELLGAIENQQFIAGWSDFVATNNGYEVLGTSQNYSTYRDYRRDARDLAKLNVYFLSALVINRVVSAIDALMGARANNLALYENEVSWLDKTRAISYVSLNERSSLQTDVKLFWEF